MLCVLVVGLLVPATALADNSVLNGYGGQASTPVIKVGKASPPATDVENAPVVQVKGASPATSGTLPFTGTDLVWFVLAGGALLVVGAGLRKFGNERS